MKKIPVVCINGDFVPAPEARVPALDGGVLFGRGLFETILVVDGRPMLVKRHLKRLFTSAAALSIPPPFPPDEIEALLHGTAAGNGLDTGAVRVTMTAGAEGGRPNLIIHSRLLPYTREHYDRGFRCGFVSIPRNERSPLVGHKTTNYFENLLARREARLKGLDEGLFLNTRGEVAEGAASNIFLVRGGGVVTPDAESGLLPGIMREVVLEVCRELGIPAEKRKVLPEELLSSDEVFITNSLLGIMPLTAVDGHAVGRGDAGITGLLSRELQRTLVMLSL